MLDKPEITQEQVQKLLEYSEITGEFKWRTKFARHIIVGSTAGSFKKASGEVIISIQGISYSAHRLAWLYVYGKHPTRRLEHINGDRKDNRISNLRQQDFVGENGKQPNIGVSQDFIFRAEQALSNKGADITVSWDKLSLQAQSRFVEIKCNKCSTVGNCSTNGLTKGRFHCNSCTRVKYTEQADFVGVDYVDHKGNTVYVTCRCCGELLKSSSGALRKQMPPRCTVCAENKCNASATERGFDYLGMRPNRLGSKHTMVAVKCREDGAEIVLPMTQLIAGYINCVECRLNRYRLALLQKECSLIDVESGRGKCRITYRTPSGAIFTATSSRVLRGEFKTNTMGHWHKYHSVYLIVNWFNDSVYYKIGTAVDPTKRLRHLKLLGRIELFTLESFLDRFGADKLEKELHREFTQFKLDPEVAKTFTGRTLKRKRVGQVERVGVKDGVSEWYQDDKVFETLSKRYNLREQ
jgi:hypothetical protein